MIALTNSAHLRHPPLRTHLPVDRDARGHQNARLRDLGDVLDMLDLGLDAGLLNGRFTASSAFTHFAQPGP